MNDNLFENVMASADNALSGNSASSLELNVDDLYSISQVRTNFEDIESLANAILSNGQETPIVVYSKDENGKHCILHGERRYRAFCLLKEQGHNLPIATYVKKSAVMIDHDGEKIASGDTRMGQMVDNVQRDDLKPSEIAAEINLLMSEPYNFSAVDISEKMGKSKSWVSAYKRLSGCSNEILKVEKSGIYDRDLLVALVKIEELDKLALSSLLANFKDDYNSITRKYVLEFHDKLKHEITDPLDVGEVLKLKNDNKTVKKHLENIVASIATLKESNEYDKIRLSLAIKEMIVVDLLTPQDFSTKAKALESLRESFDYEIGSAESGASDTGASDTGASDTGASDTGASDTGASDTGASDTGNDKNDDTPFKPSDEDIEISFDSGWLAIGDFQQELSKDEAQDLVNKLNEWINN